MGDVKLIIGAFAIGIIILVGFGATFIEMASNPTHGYDVELSDAFKTTFTNTSDAKALVGDVSTIGYNMSDEIQSAKAKPFDDFYDPTQVVQNTLSIPLQLLNFVKNFVVAVAQYLGLPPIVIGVSIMVMLFVLILTAYKALTKVDL